MIHAEVKTVGIFLIFPGIYLLIEPDFICPYKPVTDISVSVV